MLAGRLNYALIAALAVAGLAGVSVATWSGGAHRRSAQPTPVRVAVPSSNWDLIRTAASLRRNALAPHRTAFHRHFAAYMGLSALVELRHALRGRCAVAVSYLYDNLLDLHDAYTGEDWTALRRAVASEPSLEVCAPGHRTPHGRVQYVE